MHLMLSGGVCNDSRYDIRSTNGVPLRSRADMDGDDALCAGPYCRPACEGAMAQPAERSSPSGAVQPSRLDTRQWLATPRRSPGLGSRRS